MGLLGRSLAVDSKIRRFKLGSPSDDEASQIRLGASLPVRFCPFSLIGENETNKEIGNWELGIIHEDMRI